MKNIIKIIFAAIAFAIPLQTMWTFNFTSWDFYYSWGGWGNSNTVNLDYWPTLKDSIKYSRSGWLQTILGLFMPKTELYLENGNPSILFYLKTIVNTLLWFVSLIAMIIMIFAFYMIFFKKDDAGVTTARQMIKWIVIALAVIWFSRIVVSFLYWFEAQSTDLSFYTTILNSLI